jgi:hypothetical protein
MPSRLKIDKLPDYWMTALLDSSPKPPLSIIFVRKKLYGKSIL